MALKSHKLVVFTPYKDLYEDFSGRSYNPAGKPFLSPPRNFQPGAGRLAAALRNLRSFGFAFVKSTRQGFGGLGPSLGFRAEGLG